MTLKEALEMIDRGELPKEYKTRAAKIRRLSTERDFLIDGIEVLGDDPRSEKKKKRLMVVNDQLLKLIEMPKKS